MSGQQQCNSQGQVQGMDTEVAREMAQGMRQHGERIAGVVERLLPRVEGLQGGGEAIELIKQDFQTLYAGAIQAAQTLDEQGHVMRRHADRQDAISS